ncbi:putative transmembrane pheromone receptor [Coprinellus micaceus]|uniref:Putative transmembrane pheromone receptor n=1 Tax=Coprinellus micaceus TaxID=71717 RepID=A0A4Y7SN58_COPMI|nr:putative transmembrane pheromone receptor [Coprinellus micaceus]
MTSSYDPTYPLFPIFSFLAFLLSLVPLPWHIQAWNSGTCAYMIWTAVACLNSFINSIVWRDHARDIAPVWCDISSKIIIGVSVGIPASVLCISRRLYTLTAVKTVAITSGDKRRMVLIDLLIAVVVPVIIMVLHYVVQGHRFDILAQVGCYPVVYNSIPAYFLYFMWPLVLGVISFVYSALTLQFFWLRRAQFTSLFSHSSGITASRYLRLMLLAIADMLCTVPLGIFTLYFGVNDGRLRPWISWENTHYNFSRVVLVPAVFWRHDPNFEVSVELTRWLPVVCGFIFFALFGFAAEAKKVYTTILWGVATRLGFERNPEARRKVGLPSWVKPFKTSTTASQSSPISTDNTRLSVHRKSPLTFTSSATTLSTDGCVHTYPYSRGMGLENSASHAASSFASLPSDPPYPRAPPQDIPLDVYPHTQLDSQPSPTSSAPFSDSTTTVVADSGNPKGSASLKRKLSLESITSVERGFMEASGRHLPPTSESPPPFANVAATVFHRPLSPTLEYPEVYAHPSSATAYAPSSDGIVVTIQKTSSTSPALSSSSQFD